MITMLKNWKGPVEINGVQYENIGTFISGNKSLSGEISIKTMPGSERGCK